MLTDRLLETTLECGATVRYRPMDDAMRTAFLAIPHIKDQDEQRRAWNVAAGRALERCVVWWSCLYREPGKPDIPLPINRGLAPFYSGFVSDVLVAVAREDGVPWPEK